MCRERANMFYTRVLKLDAPISVELPSKVGVATASMLQTCVVVGGAWTLTLLSPMQRSLGIGFYQLAL